jgi:PilZ domain
MAAQSPNHMASNLGPVAGSMNGCDGIERRGAVRVAIPFPATVRGMDQTGDRFTLDTVLDNLSSTGLYLRSARLVEPGATLFVVVRLAVVSAQQVAAASVAVRGVVLRSELQPGGTYGIGVVFNGHRFLYAVAT